MWLGSEGQGMLAEYYWPTLHANCGIVLLHTKIAVVKNILDLLVTVQ
jgi:hypothetical protein